MIAVSHLNAYIKDIHSLYAGKCLGTCCLLIFPKINSLKELFNKYLIRMSNSLDPDQVKHFFSPGLLPNYLQRLSVEDTSKHKVTGNYGGLFVPFRYFVLSSFRLALWRNNAKRKDEITKRRQAKSEMTKQRQAKRRNNEKTPGEKRNDETTPGEKTK